MNCQENNQSENCGGSSLELPLDIDRKEDAVVPMSLDFDSICLNYQLPRYLVPTACETTLDEMAFSLDYNGRSLLIGSESLAMPRYDARVHMESLFQSHPISDKTESQPKEPLTKKKKSYSKRGPKADRKLEEGVGKVSSKGNHKKSEEKENNLEVEGNKGKEGVEPPTEDSASTFETVSFPGLAGSQAYFKKGACIACKSSKVVFWFGDASVKRRGDNFTCADCIKSCIGEQRFLSLFQIECQWDLKENLTLSQKKPWNSLKEYLIQVFPQNNDLILMSIHYLLDEKSYSIQKTLEKLNKLLILQKTKGDLDTFLLCLRFVHDLIESLNRLAEIRASFTLKGKYECMDELERQYFQRKVAIIEPLVSEIKIESMRHLKAETTRAKDQDVCCVTPARSFAFGLEYYETPALGKRDPEYRNLDSFPGIEEQDMDNSYKIAPYNCDYLLPPQY